MPSRPHRFAWVAVLAIACQQTPPTTGPDAGAAAAEASGTVTLRYGQRPLRQKTTLEMSERGGDGRYLEFAITLDTTMAFERIAQKVKASWRVEEVGDITMAGAYSRAKGAADLLRAEGKWAYLVDLRGQPDDQASAKLHENLERARFLSTAKPGAGQHLLRLIPEALRLPVLPEAPLSVGKPVTVEDEGETVFDSPGGSIVVPTFRKAVYTLVQVDGSSGARVAEVQFAEEAGGDLQGEKASLIIERRAEATLLFDVDKGVPVSYDLTREESFEAGEFASLSDTIVRASWEPR